MPTFICYFNTNFLNLLSLLMVIFTRQKDSYYDSWAFMKREVILLWWFAKHKTHHGFCCTWHSVSQLKICNACESTKGDSFIVYGIPGVQVKRAVVDLRFYF